MPNVRCATWTPGRTGHGRVWRIKYRWVGLFMCMNNNNNNNNNIYLTISLHVHVFVCVCVVGPVRVCVRCMYQCVCVYIYIYIYIYIYMYACVCVCVFLQMAWRIWTGDQRNLEIYKIICSICETGLTIWVKETHFFLFQRTLVKSFLYEVTHIEHGHCYDRLLSLVLYFQT